VSGRSPSGFGALARGHAPVGAAPLAAWRGTRTTTARPAAARAAALALGLLAAGLLFALMVVAALAGAGLPQVDGGGAGFGASARARADIPPRYLALYERAAARYGLDWAILAAIGKVECDHGRDPDPSCTKEGAVNSAGAGGPMQFLAATFAQYGVAPGGGRPDRWRAADAIYSAAAYLRASGAPGAYRAAIFAYNHADWYVAEVQRWAAIYRGPAFGGGDPGAGAGAPGPGDAGFPADAEGEADGLEDWPGVGAVRYTRGSRALLWRRDGHVALVPAEAPAVVQAMVIAGNELQDLPYGAGGHPDPRGAASEDCSSTVNYVLYRSGVRPIAEILAANPLAQDYLGWGEPGPGRWVTIYATAAPTDHVFVVIAGLRLDTSHNGTDVGPNRYEDGPRWRLLDHIPTWAHWSVRHPPGL
jgi:transglycosylase-like protein with SLT domain